MHLVSEKEIATINNSKEELLNRLNSCKYNSYKVFDVLKQEIEIKYEIIEQTAEDISKLIKIGEYNKAFAQLRYLEDLIFSMRKNAY